MKQQQVFITFHATWLCLSSWASDLSEGSWLVTPSHHRKLASVIITARHTTGIWIFLVNRFQNKWSSILLSDKHTIQKKNWFGLKCNLFNFYSWLHLPTILSLTHSACLGPSSSFTSICCLPSTETLLGASQTSCIYSLNKYFWVPAMCNTSLISPKIFKVEII